MNKSTLGVTLLKVYLGLIIFVFVVIVRFSIFGTLMWVSQPLLMVMNMLPGIILTPFRLMGLNGLLIFLTLLQGAILYFGGNALDKYIKNTRRR